MLSSEELINIRGGSKTLTGGIIGTIITFVIGVIDGYFRPMSCYR